MKLSVILIFMLIAVLSVGFGMHHDSTAAGLMIFGGIGAAIMLFCVFAVSIKNLDGRDR